MWEEREGGCAWVRTWVNIVQKSNEISGRIKGGFRIIKESHDLFKYHSVAGKIGLQLFKESSEWIGQVGHCKHSARAPEEELLVRKKTRHGDILRLSWWSHVELRFWQILRLSPCETVPGWDLRLGQLWLLLPCEAMPGWEAGKDGETVHVGGNLGLEFNWAAEYEETLSTRQPAYHVLSPWPNIFYLGH